MHHMRRLVICFCVVRLHRTGDCSCHRFENQPSFIQGKLALSRNVWGLYERYRSRERHGCGQFGIGTRAACSPNLAEGNSRRRLGRHRRLDMPLGLRIRQTIRVDLVPTPMALAKRAKQVRAPTAIERRASPAEIPASTTSVPNEGSSCG
jgi:hypothetical protein